MPDNSAACAPLAVPRVSIVGSTDMPGLSSPFRLPSSMAIFTGMRCTTLVKLPVALSGGSSENSSPLAGDRLSTWPFSVTPGKLSTRMAAGSPAAHRRQLRLLEIADDIDGVEGNDSHELGAGGHILAYPERTCADRAGDRRNDRCIGQIQFGLSGCGQGTVTLGHRLSTPSHQDRDLGLGGSYCGLCAGQTGGCLLGECAARLSLPYSVRAIFCQFAVPLGIGPRELERGFCGSDRCHRLLNDRMLQHDLGIQVLDGGLRRAEVGPRRRERCLEIPVVYAGKNLSRLDPLVISDKNLGDVAGDLRCDRRIIRLHVGVVRRFEISARRPVVMTVVPGPGRPGEQGNRNQAALDEAAPTSTRPGGSRGRYRLRRVGLGGLHFGPDLVDPVLDFRHLAKIPALRHLDHHGLLRLSATSLRAPGADVKCAAEPVMGSDDRNGRSRRDRCSCDCPAGAGHARPVRRFMPAEDDGTSGGWGNIPRAGFPAENREAVDTDGPATGRRAHDTILSIRV